MPTLHHEMRAKDVWRVLLFAHDGSELLLLKRASGLCLPELSIPRCQRVAPNLREAAKHTWNLDTVCLFPFDIPGPDHKQQLRKYHVMELRSSEELARIAPHLACMPALNEGSFADVRDYLAVRHAMDRDWAWFGKDCLGPFSDFASFGRISAWVQEQLQPLGRRWTGNYRQLQAGASFALIRFEADQGSFWFKATGEPNQREFSITLALATQFPKYVPKLIATHEDWNACLAEEAKGDDLFSAADPAMWCRAVAHLAELQIASKGHVSELLAKGAHDARTSRLLGRTVPFFSTITRLMEAQATATPRKLTAREIATVQRQVVEALREMEAVGIPDTLNHFDLNPGNVIAAGECKFLDWSEAAVGNPFFSMEFLRQHFLQTFAGNHDAESEFRNCYVDCWRSVLPTPTLERLSELVPLVAVFAFAAISLSWDDPRLDTKPRTAAFLRSLARRMYRECQRLPGLAV